MLFAHLPHASSAEKPEPDAKPAKVTLAMAISAVWREPAGAL